MIKINQSVFYFALSITLLLTACVSDDNDTDESVNVAPVTVNDIASTLEDTAVVIDLVANDTDLDGAIDVTSITVTAASKGVIVSNGDGTVTYTPNTDSNGSDSFTYTVKDNKAALSNVATVNLSITPVNDAPSFSAGSNESSVSDGNAVTISNWASSLSAGPVDESAQTLSFTIVSNDNPGLFSVAPLVDPVSGTLTYTSSLNASGTSNIDLQLMDNGGTANGGVDTSPTQTFTITLTPNQPPVVNNENYSALGNTLLEVGVTPSGFIAVKLVGSVLDNDADSDGPVALSVSSVGMPVLGAVDMNANGSFSYTPPVGQSPVLDSFSYDVFDGEKTTTGTVNISITERIWYVDNRNSGGSGVSSDSFSSLADAGPVVQSGDTIYVANGDGSTTGLDTGLVISVPDVRLKGEGVALEVGGITLAAAGVRPTISNITGDGLTLTEASNTQVTGLDIADTLGDGLKVDNSIEVKLTSLTISRSGESAIQGSGENIGLVLSDVIIDKVDVTDPSSSDDAIFIAATGSSSLLMTGGSISGVPGSLGDGIEFENATINPVVMNMDIRGVNFFDIAQDGIKLDNDSGVMNVQIGGLNLAESNSFLNIGFRGIQIQTGDDTVLDRTNTILIQNNIITTADEGIQIRSINDNTELSILGNLLDRAVGGSSKDLIDLQTEFSANMQARVNRNTINNVGGSDGIKVRVFDGASLTLEALGNTIDGPLEGFDFDVIDGVTTPTRLNATVLNNTLSNITAVALDARNADTTSSTCLDLVANSSVANYVLDAVVGNFALTIGSQATVFDPAGGTINSTPVSCNLPVF